MGVLLLVAAIIAALFGTQIGSRIGCAISEQVAQIAGSDTGECGGADAASGRAGL